MNEWNNQPRLEKREHRYPVGMDCLGGGPASGSVSSNQLWGNQRASAEEYIEFVHLAVCARVLAMMGLLNGQRYANRKQKY